MAVMVNSMGGGTELRGPIYVKEFRATGEAGAFTEVVNLTGPGRLIQAVGIRSTNGSSYSAASDNIEIKIIPDGDETRALKKIWVPDSCTSTAHLPASALMASLSVPEVTGSSVNRIPDHTTIDYSNIMSDRVLSARDWHGTYPSSAPRFSYPGNAEGIGDSVVDQTLTIYQDGMFFDNNLVVSGRWGRYQDYSFNGVILVYQIFD